MAVELNKFTSADELEIAITGPDDANRLFIYSGIVEVARHSSDEGIDRFAAFIDLSTKHNRNFPPSPRTVAAPVAYLASLHGSSKAEDCTWAIDHVSTDLSGGKLKVLLDLAVQGENDDFNRVAYHVSVRTQVPLQLAGVIIYPPSQVIRSGEIGVVSALLSAPAPQGGVPIVFSVDNSQIVTLDNPNISIPAGVALGGTVFHTVAFKGPNESVTLATAASTNSIFKTIAILGN